MLEAVIFWTVLILLAVKAMIEFVENKLRDLFDDHPVTWACGLVAFGVVVGMLL